MKVHPPPLDNKMYFLHTTPPYITGACSPSLSATSTKRALKVRPEAAGLGMGLAVWVETPCASKRPARRASVASIPSCANLRRVRFITNNQLSSHVSCRVPTDVQGFSLHKMRY